MCAAPLFSSYHFSRPNRGFWVLASSFSTSKRRTALQFFVFERNWLTLIISGCLPPEEHLIISCLSLSPALPSDNRTYLLIGNNSVAPLRNGPSLVPVLVQITPVPLFLPVSRSIHHLFVVVPHSFMPLSFLHMPKYICMWSVTPGTCGHVPRLWRCFQKLGGFPVN